MKTLSSSSFKLLTRFILYLFLFAGLSYAVHYTALEEFGLENLRELIIFAYKFNVGVTLLFTSTIILARKILKEQLGFIFLISGFVKLAVFLFLINRSELEINKSVFLHFFIPYVACVVLEITYVIKILNRTDFSKTQ